MQPAASGNTVTYRCDDGTGTRLHVTYEAHAARVRIGKGVEATLPRAESASKGGGDVYVGETMSLMRDDAMVQLYRDAVPLRCRPE